MKRKNTIWSLVLALVMVLGVIAPLSALAKDEPAPTVGTIESKDISTTKPTDTKLTIHKLQADSYDSTKVPAKHNGGKLGEDQLKTLGSNVKELDGVTFTCFKFTDAKKFKELVDNPGSYTTADKVTAAGGTLYNPEIQLGKNEKPGEATTITTKDGEGVTITIKDDGFYWFIESGYKKVGDGPDSITSSIAVPFGISVPLTNTTKIEDGSKVYEPGTVYLKNVHVYPKNVTGNEPTPDKDVNEIGQKSATFDIGKPVEWIIHSDIPANIKDYYEYSLTDKLDDKLTYKDGSAKVYYGNFKTKTELEEATPLDGSYYTLNYDNNTKTLKVELNTEVRDDNKTYVKDIYNSVKPASEKNKLYVKFEADINDKAIMGQDIKNNVDLTFKNKSKPDGKKNPIPEEKKPKVVTGGKLFKKVNNATPEKALENAVFTIKHKQVVAKESTAPNDNDWKAIEDLKWTDQLIAANKAAIEAGKFATKPDAEKEEYKPTSTTNLPAKDSVIYLRSSADGTFEIKGLELSKYTPQKWDGEKLADLTPVHNYYALKEVKAPKDYAKLEEVKTFDITTTSYQKNPDKIDLGLADPDKIKNTELTIPQTGGMGTMIFMVAGLALMGGAFIAMKKRSAEQA